MDVNYKLGKLDDKSFGHLKNILRYSKEVRRTHEIIPFTQHTWYS